MGIIPSRNRALRPVNVSRSANSNNPMVAWTYPIIPPRQSFGCIVVVLTPAGPRVDLSRPKLQRFTPEFGTSNECYHTAIPVSNSAVTCSARSGHGQNPEGDVRERFTRVVPGVTLHGCCGPSPRASVSAFLSFYARATYGHTEGASIAGSTALGLDPSDFQSHQVPAPQAVFVNWRRIMADEKVAVHPDDAKSHALIEDQRADTGVPGPNLDGGHAVRASP